MDEELTPDSWPDKAPRIQCRLCGGMLVRRRCPSCYYEGRTKNRLVVKSPKLQVELIEHRAKVKDKMRLWRQRYNTKFQRAQAMTRALEIFYWILDRFEQDDQGQYQLYEHQAQWLLPLIPVLKKNIENIAKFMQVKGNGPYSGREHIAEWWKLLPPGAPPHKQIYEVKPRPPRTKKARRK